MASNRIFLVALIGDVGRNLFTHARETFTDKDARDYQPYGRGLMRPQLNLDIAVSTGVAFMRIAFKELFFSNDNDLHAKINRLDLGIKQEEEAYQEIMRAISNVSAKSCPTVELYSCFPKGFQPQKPDSLDYSTLLTRSLYFIEQFVPLGGKEKDKKNGPYRISRVMPLRRIDLPSPDTKKLGTEKPEAPAENATTEFGDFKVWKDSDGKPVAEPIFQTHKEYRGVYDYQLPNVVVVSEAGGEWHLQDKEMDAGTDGNPSIADFLNKTLSQGDNDIRVIVNASLHCPEVEEIGNSTHFEVKFWKLLDSDKYRKNVCVICCASSLRHASAVISSRLSLEQTVDDLIEETKRFARLRQLLGFGHLIIRFGTTIAVHFNNRIQPPTVKVIFTPASSEIDPDSHGRVNGKNTMLAAAIVGNLAKHADKNGDEEAEAVVVEDALITGMKMCWAAQMAGFRGDKPDPFGSEGNGDKLIAGLVRTSKPIFNKLMRKSDTDLSQFEKKPDKDEAKFFAVKVPLLVIDRDKDFMWEIIREQVDSPRVDSNSNLASRINIALAITMFGVDLVLNQSSIQEAAITNILKRPNCILSNTDPEDYKTLPANHLPSLPDLERFQRHGIPKLEEAPLKPVYCPIMKIDKLVSVERRVIESVRSILNAMIDYARRDDSRPLSIAVFGPPGTGKSFTVKEIVNSVNGLENIKKKLEFLEYNVAQFREIKELATALTHVASVSNEGSLPVVFFDEFDCALDGDPLAWLKYFLAPMQDGKFYDATTPVAFGRAIFIFAGGVSPSFNAFVTQRKPNEKESPERNRAFEEQKGPDFVSRLRAHLDVSPVNGDDEAEKPVIRRAILLRGLIESEKLFTRKDDLDVCIVQEDILYAMLTIDRYHHGVRSMTAILKMCAVTDGQIANASLPSRAQLDMHVNADEFFIRIQRSRFRRMFCDNADDRGGKKPPNKGIGKTPFKNVEDTTSTSPEVPS